MICQYAYLSQSPAIFQTLTGLRPREFLDLVADVLPQVVVAEQQRLARPQRQRAPGGGRHADLTYTDQILLTVIWLRQYPTNEVLGYLFGVSDSTVSRVLQRIRPVLDAAGRDTLRMPDPGRKRRKDLPTLLAATPALAVLVDTFEQRVQRPRDRPTADGYYSGKKKQHTLKSQIVVDETTGTICHVSESVRGPTADITLLRQSGVLAQLPDGVGIVGDLAYVGVDQLHPIGLGATPRRKPRGRDRPPADVAFNRAFAQRRVTVEHTIGRLRRYQCLTHTDRHHRHHHTARVRAVAGLVNRQLRARLPA